MDGITISELGIRENCGISVRYEESMTPSGVSTRVGGCSRVMDDVKVREGGGAVSYIYFGTNEES